MTIRQARAAEAEALTELAIRSKASWGYDEAFMQKARPDMLVSAADIERAHCLVAEEQGRIFGYVLTFIDREHAFLRDLFIEPSHFNRGLGSRLFHRAIDEARARGAQTLTLHADPNARLLRASWYALYGRNRLDYRKRTHVTRHAPRSVLDCTHGDVCAFGRLG